MKHLVEIRNDDVLQPFPSTKHMRRLTQEKSLFEYFMEADEVFEHYNYPQILACVAEGVHQQKWVEHIRKNRHRYKIELHALYHVNYRKFPDDLLFLNLSAAKRMLEDTFECEVTKWYLPFGRKGVPPNGDEICEKVGIKMDHQLDRKIDSERWMIYYNKSKRTEVPWEHVNFHYWYEPQVKGIKKILEICSQL